MSIEKVREYLQKYNKDQEIIELNDSIATVALAAKALNVSEGQIAKSLAFRFDDDCILVVAAGDAKIDNGKFKKEFQTKARMLDEESTLKLTGHPVGGVCPFALTDNVKVYLDQSLQRYLYVYPACGSSTTAICLSIRELETITKALKWVDVTKLKEEEIEYPNRKDSNCVKWDSPYNKYDEKTLTPFWVADSDFATPKPVIEALVARAQHGVFGYTFPGDSYYQAISKWFLGKHQYEIKKEWIVPNGGVVAILSTVIQYLLPKGANILVQPPIYNPFYDVVKDNQCRLVLNNLLVEEEEYTIDFLDLDKKLANCQMMILCSPHNPVGRVYTEEELQKIVELCKKHDCILMSDEIHCDIIMPGYHFVSIGKFIDQYEKIIICTAPSKTFNIAGLCCANAIIPNEHLRAKYQENLFKSKVVTYNIFGLAGCEAAYRFGQQWLEKQITLINNNYQMVTDFFKTNFPQVKIAPLQGTYLMWLNLRTFKLSSQQLNEIFQKGGILLNQGTLYSQEYDGYMRLNIACSPQQLQIALDTFKEVLKNYE